LSDASSTNYDMTGKYDENNNIKYVVSIKDMYEITIRLTEDDKFIDILEIKINKDFRNFKQKMNSLGHFNVDQYYEDITDEQKTHEERIDEQRIHEDRTDE